MRGLTKVERHALRQAVRIQAKARHALTATELTDMHPAECRVAMAEMRKRGYVLSRAVTDSFWWRP